MRSSLAILSLWICFNIDATTSNVCPEPPKVENAQISQTSLKSVYSNDDEVDYICDRGFVSMRKITYKCKNKIWSTQRYVQCTLKRCEFPADIPNGQYAIIAGDRFVVGTTIKYTCKEGYQMMSRVYIRTCRPGGWDNQLPSCEEVICSADMPSDKLVKAEGLPDYGDLIRYGHRLQFSCAERGYALKGPQEISCKANGDWSDAFPYCEEITCKLNETEDYTVERIPNQVGPIKPGHKIKLACTEQGMIIRNKREIICQDDGEWNIPLPKCEEQTCIANITNMIVDGRRNLGVTLHKPGKTLKLSCDQNQGLSLDGQSEITCMEDGEWSSQFPSCLPTSCGKPPVLSDRNADTVHLPDSRKTKYHVGEVVYYGCFTTYTMEGPPYLTCQKGTWKGNFNCIPPCLASVPEMDVRNIELKKGGRERMFCPHTDHITFVCQTGKYRKINSVDFRQQCLYGKMTLPECE